MHWLLDGHPSLPALLTRKVRNWRLPYPSPVCAYLLFFHSLHFFVVIKESSTLFLSQGMGMLSMSFIQNPPKIYAFVWI